MTLEDVLKRIDFEKSWLYECGIFGSDVDIAFHAIKKSVIEALEQEPCEDAVSRQAVIDEIEFFQINPQHFDFVSLIDNIKDLPSVNPQKPCKDAISREELLKAVYTWDKFGCDADNKLVQYKDHYIPYIHYDDVVKCIKGMPSVNPQKIGRWIVETGDRETGYGGCTMCSECSGEGDTEMDYCPNCGAKMSESEEEE